MGCLCCGSKKLVNSPRQYGKASKDAHCDSSASCIFSLSCREDTQHLSCSTVRMSILHNYMHSSNLREFTSNTTTRSVPVCFALQSLEAYRWARGTRQDKRFASSSPFLLHILWRINGSVPTGKDLVSMEVWNCMPVVSEDSGMNQNVDTGVDMGR
eukprot:2074662-Amphidinium_carterae.1